MRYLVTIEPDYLKVQAQTNGSPGEARELLYAVAEVVFKHGRRPILICAAGCKPLSLADLYVLTRHVVVTPIRHGRIAFLYDADRSFKSSGFIEELSAGRALDMAIFSTETEAVRWLRRDNRREATEVPGSMTDSPVSAK